MLGKMTAAIFSVPVSIRMWPCGVVTRIDAMLFAPTFAHRNSSGRCHTLTRNGTPHQYGSTFTGYGRCSPDRPRAAAQREPPRVRSALMRRLPILACLALLISASNSPTLHASDEPPFTALASSTYLGNYGFDEIKDVVVDADGFVYAAGWADYGWSTNGFVAKLSPDGSQVLYFTWIGGSAFEIANSLALDPTGGIVVAGHTTSSDFPVVNGFQTELHGDSDGWIANLDAAGTIVYSTYYGGSSFENGMAMAIGPMGAIYVTGSTGP